MAWKYPEFSLTLALTASPNMPNKALYFDAVHIASLLGVMSKV